MKVKVDIDKAIIRFDSPEERKIFIRHIYNLDDLYKEKVKKLIIRIKEDLSIKKIKG